MAELVTGKLILWDGSGRYLVYDQRTFSEHPYVAYYLGVDGYYGCLYEAKLVNSGIHAGQIRFIPVNSAVTDWYPTITYTAGDIVRRYTTITYTNPFTGYTGNTLGFYRIWEARVNNINHAPPTTGDLNTWWKPSETTHLGCDDAYYADLDEDGSFKLYLPNSCCQSIPVCQNAGIQNACSLTVTFSGTTDVIDHCCKLGMNDNETYTFLSIDGTYTVPLVAYNWHEAAFPGNFGSRVGGSTWDCGGGQVYLFDYLTVRVTRLTSTVKVEAWSGFVKVFQATVSPDSGTCCEVASPVDNDYDYLIESCSLPSVGGQVTVMEGEV